MNQKSRRKLFKKLLDYSWPGNVRELQNAMEYAVVLARQNKIGVKELPTEVQLPAALQQTERNNHSGTGVQNLDDMERNAIIQALAQCHGTRKKPRRFSAFSVRRFTIR